MYNFDDDLKRWREYANKIHSRFQEERWDFYILSQGLIEPRAHKLIAGFSRSKKRILELGVGGGEHFHFEKGSGDRDLYVGVDIILDCVRIAKKENIPHVINANGVYLPFCNQRFDCCIAFGVLEHVGDLEGMFREINRVLDEEGEFLVVVPTNGSLVVDFFKKMITYPSLYIRGIRRPSWIWHYENVNHFKRINCLISKSFVVKESRGIPFRLIPWHFSPLWFFRCLKRNNER